MNTLLTVIVIDIMDIIDIQSWSRIRKMWGQLKMASQGINNKPLRLNFKGFFMSIIGRV